MVISLLISIICSIISIVQAVHSKKSGYVGTMPNVGRGLSIISLVIVAIGIIFVVSVISSIINSAHQAAYFYGG